MNHKYIILPLTCYNLYHFAIVYHLCYLCLVFAMLLRLFIASLLSPEAKEQTSWLFVCDVYCDFVTYPFGILGQVWYLIVWIPDPCYLSDFKGK